MNKHYKLTITNKKKILKEDFSDFTVDRFTNPFKDLYKIISNTFKGTLLNLTAQLEWIVIAPTIKSFANLSALRAKFQEKITQSRNMFNDAIPEAIRDDVDMLFNITNPGAFISSNLIDDIKSGELEKYTPFAWFSKRLISGEFEASDVSNWGQGIGPFKWIKFNNMLWYKGWLYKDMIINNVEKVRGFINQGGLKSFDNIFKDVNKEDDLRQLFPIYSATIAAYDMLKFYNGGSIILYDFFKDTQQELLDISTKSIRLSAQINNLRGNVRYTEEMRKLDNEIEQEWRSYLNKFKTALDKWARDTSNNIDNMVRISETIYRGISGIHTPLESRGQDINNPDPIYAQSRHNVISQMLQIAEGSRNPVAGTWNATGGNALNKVLNFVGMGENYKLQIKNNQKIIIENKNKYIEKLKQVGIDTSKVQINDAQKVVLENVIDQKKMNNYSETWKQAINKFNQIKPNDPEEKKVNMFLEMAEYSTKFFLNVKDNLSNSLDNIKNQKSDESIRVNQKLKSEFQFELTPQGFAKKAIVDFDLLCQTTKNSLISYLIIIEPVLKEFDILVNFLNVENNDDLKKNIDELKKDIIEKTNIFKNNKDIQSNYENIFKELEKLFKKESERLQAFRNDRMNSIKLLEETQKRIQEFCDNLIKMTESFKELPDLEKYKNLIDLIKQTQESNKEIKEKIYNKLLPDLIKQEKAFSVDIFKQKEELNKMYSGLLKKLDINSFDFVYQKNKKQFDDVYKNSINYIGRSYESSKFKKNEDLLLKIKSEYENKIKEIEREINTKKEESVNQESNIKNQENMSLKINNSTKNINPISVK